MSREEKKKKFGIDTQTGRLHLGVTAIPLPKSRSGRITIGSVLVVGGCLGFLPILGFWMVPLGLVVLSHDLAVVRRQRRRFSVWWEKRRRKPQEGDSSQQ